MIGEVIDLWHASQVYRVGSLWLVYELALLLPVLLNGTGKRDPPMSVGQWLQNTVVRWTAR